MLALKKTNDSALAPARDKGRGLARRSRKTVRLDDQVIHNDYSTRNILFEGDIIRAVIDFRRKRPVSAA